MYSAIDRTLSDTTQLHNYVKTGDLASIRGFVAQYKTSQGLSRLKYGDHRIINAAVRDAILFEHAHIVEYFIREEHVDPNDHAFHNNHLERFISFAVRSSNLKIVELLVTTGAYINNSPDKYSDIRYDDAIRTAVIENQTEIALYLLSHGAPATGVIEPRRCEPFLARAARNGNNDLVTALVNNGASIEAAFYNLSYNGPYGEFKTHYYQTAKTLLDYAIGIDLKKRYWRSVLFEGLNISHFNFIGVSIDGIPVSRNALTHLNLHGVENALVTINDIEKLHEEPMRKMALKNRITQKLLQCGRIDLEGILNLVPLQQAAAVGDIDTVIVRLAAGVDPNEEGEDYSHAYKKIIPIVVAAEAGHLAVVELLASHPRINKQDITTAIWQAKRYEFQSIVSFLEQQHDVNTSDRDGNTLLHLAAYIGDVNAVRKLLTQGADSSLLNNKSESPRHIAARHDLSRYLIEDMSKQYEEILALLLEQEAKITDQIHLTSSSLVSVLRQSGSPIYHSESNSSIKNIETMSIADDKQDLPQKQT